MGEKAPDFKKAWLDRKPTLGTITTFPNLPYFIDTNGVALTQSNTILRYIGRQYNLCGQQQQHHIVDLALDQLADAEGSMVRISYTQGAPALESWYQEQVPSLLAQWEILLGDNDYLTGTQSTVADAKLYEYLRKVRIVQVEICKDSNTTNAVGGSAKLGAFMKRFEEIPAIKTYMASQEYLSRPLNNPHAKFK